MPEQDELVLAVIKKIMPYGAFCALEEYGNREAFVHISEVAPRWIKNIHEFLHEGQKVVAKIYQLVPEKNQIDLSLKRVSEAERKRKLEMVKRTRRADKLFEVAVAQSKISPSEVLAAKTKILSKYGDMFDALEEISVSGEEAIKDLKLDRGLAKALLGIAQKNIKQVKASLKGILKLANYSSQGVTFIKNALGSATPPQGAQLKITYLGAPRYQIEVSAQDFKAAQKAMEGIVESIQKMADKNTFVSFEQLKEES